MQIIILDGAESIGGTKLYLGTTEGGILVDFGINYKRWGMYYEEYLRPRAARGILDLLQLSLIPPIPSLYREDLIPKDLKIEGQNLNVNALFLSHAHMDHCGLMGVIRREVPLFASAATIAIMKAMQDTGAMDFYSELAYTIPRNKIGDVLEAADWRKEGFQARTVYIVDDARERLQEFWAKSPNPKGRKLLAHPLKKWEGRIGGMNFWSFCIDHSIPGATAFVFQTDAGNILYTGDIRMHGKRRKLTEEFLSSAKKLTPSVLVIEGTRAGSQTENVSEEEVYRNALCIVKRNPGKLVVADFGPRNFERMQTFLQIASQSGRTLLVLPKDMYLLEAISCAQDEWSLILEDAHLGIFDDVRVEKRAWDQVIRERYKGELVDAKSVRKYPGDFILAFSFWDIKHLLDIQPKEGVYIYSSSEPHCEEHVIDMRRLWNWLLHFGMKVYGFSLDESGNLTFSGGLHASGHASFPELINLIREIKPKHLIPIHTENASSFKEALRREPVQVHLLRNGAVFCL